MAFKISDLGVAFYTHGWTLWHYKSTDSLAEIGVPGYFNRVTDMLASGDHIHISAIDGGAIYHVSYAGNGRVETMLMASTGAGVA